MSGVSAMTEITSQPLSLDMAIEDETRQALLAHFAPFYQERVNGYVDGLLGIEGYINRFEYLRAVVGRYVFCPDSKILVGHLATE